jgi:hypothetical protein
VAVSFIGAGEYLKKTTNLKEVTDDVNTVKLVFNGHCTDKGKETA